MFFLWVLKCTTTWRKWRKLKWRKVKLLKSILVILKCMLHACSSAYSIAQYSKYNQLSTIEISTVRPSIRGIPYSMDFLDLGKLSTFETLAKKLTCLTDYIYCIPYTSTILVYHFCVLYRIPGTVVLHILQYINITFQYGLHILRYRYLVPYRYIW